MAIFSKLFRTKILLTATLLPLLTSGCMRAVKMTPLQLDQQKRMLGVIGVVSGDKTPHVLIKLPARNIPEGMKAGAEMPVIVAGSLCAGGCSGELGLLVLGSGLAMAPVGAIAGGVQSLITEDNFAVVTNGETAIKETIANLRMSKHVSERFASKLADLKTFATSTTVMKGSGKNGQEPDYRPLWNAGIQTVSEVTVNSLALYGLGVVKPDLWLTLNTRVRMLSASNNNLIISRDYSCISNTSTFEEWVAKDAFKFRESIERCYDIIAKNAVTDLFVNNTLLLPPHIRPVTPSGQEKQISDSTRERLETVGAAYAKGGVKAQD